MVQYLVKRVLALIPLMFGVMLISFVIMNMAPGDPIAVYLNPDRSTPDAATLAAIRKSLGLDRPLPVRFGFWLVRTLHGDLGYSFVSHRPVLEEITSRIWNSVLLSLISLAVSLIAGLVVGVHSALHQYTMSDYVTTVLAFVGISVPAFWFAMMMILLFTGKLHWLPSVGMTSLTAAPGFLSHIFDVATHMIMPVAVMSLASIARWARYMRSSMLEVVKQDYIRTARSKGLPERLVIYQHALRNACIPIVTLLGMALPGLIEGSFVVESMFGWPGMGRLGVSAVFSRDYPVVMGVTLFASILVMLGNLAADVTYAAVDPRIGYK